MQVESKSHEIGHFGSFLNASGNVKGLVVWYVVVSTSMEFILFLLANIHVYVVCKLAIKQYCFFLFFCLVCKTSVLPIVITWWVDRWTQYSYCSTVYSWIFTHLELPVKQLSLAKCEEDGIDTWKKKKNSRWKKNGTKTGGKDEKIDSKVQLPKWKKKLKHLYFRETSFEFKNTKKCT